MVNLNTNFKSEFDFSFFKIKNNLVVFGSQTMITMRTMKTLGPGLIVSTGNIVKIYEPDFRGWRRHPFLDSMERKAKKRESVKSKATRSSKRR